MFSVQHQRLYLKDLTAEKNVKYFQVIRFQTVLACISLSFGVSGLIGFWFFYFLYRFWGFSRRCCSQSVGWVGVRAVAWDGGPAIKKALVTDRGNALASAPELPDLEMHD